MRGDERIQDETFSCVTFEQRVPEDHPLREIRELVDAVLVPLNGEFAALTQCPGVLRSRLSLGFGRFCCRSSTRSVRSDNWLIAGRQPVVPLVLGLGMDDQVWNHVVFSKNRDRLFTSDVARRFFAEVNRLAKRFMNDERFTVDGRLIKAGAS